jgi:hypothetical protein
MYQNYEVSGISPIKEETPLGLQFIPHVKGFQEIVKGIINRYDI